MTRGSPNAAGVIVCVAALAAAAPASAEVSVEGTGEPAFTNSATNTQWVRWQVPSGTDGYRLHVRYYRDGAQVHETRVPVSANGTGWMDWTGVATLQEGSTYAICVRGEYSFPNDSLYFPEGPDTCQTGTLEGKRTHTTIDRTKPTTSIVAAGGAEFTKEQSIPLSIGFQDAVAGPFPATFVCVKAGADPCQSGFAYSSQCSVPASGGKNTTFDCNVDASGLPDGPITVCAIAADARGAEQRELGKSDGDRHAGKPLGRTVRHRRAGPPGAGADRERVEDRGPDRRVDRVLG